MTKPTDNTRYTHARARTPRPPEPQRGGPQGRGVPPYHAPPLLVAASLAALAGLTLASLAIGMHYHSWLAGLTTGLTLGSLWTLVLIRQFR